MKQLIYDIEVLSNCFTVTFLDIDTQQIHSFVVHKDRNDIDELVAFCGTVDKMIGFNNIDFDWPILDYLLINRCEPKDLYKLSQRIIESERRNFETPSIYQIDLMKLNHFDNKARSASLKWLQINMGFPVVQDMPIHHTHKVKKEEIPMILEYNLNDVKATFELYKLSLGKLEMRNKLGAKYGTDMTNFPDTKIGEYIVLKMLSDKTGTSIQALKRCRTPRNRVDIKDCMLPVEFKTEEFKELHRYFTNLSVVKDQEVSDKMVKFDGVEYYFGLGGIHACRGSDIYTNVHSADVTGYYPSLAVSQGFTPAHFGSEFSSVYGMLAKERKLYPKGSDDNIAIKLAQNGVFGKAGNEYSPFYDLMFLYKITVNGQLLLASLCEEITIQGAASVIMANTDGIEVLMKDRAKFDIICSEWEKKWGLSLEHSEYTKMVVRDINSYLAIKKDGKTKKKGFFITEPELHQDHSSLIVQEALEAYYVNGTPVETTIQKAPIGKLLIGSRARVGSFKLIDVENGIVTHKPIQKNIRFYISKTGKPLQKVSDKKKEIVHKKITLFNEWKDGPYDVDYRYYIKECYKIINLMNKQNELF